MLIPMYSLHDRTVCTYELTVGVTACPGPAHVQVKVLACTGEGGAGPHS